MFEGYILEIWQRQVPAHWIVERNGSGNDQIREQQGGDSLRYGTGFQNSARPELFRRAQRESI